MSITVKQVATEIAVKDFLRDLAKDRVRECYVALPCAHAARVLWRRGDIAVRRATLALIESEYDAIAAQARAIYDDLRDRRATMGDIARMLWSK